MILYMVVALEWLKRYPTSKGKGEAQQDGRRGESMFRIKPHTCQRHSGLKQHLCTRTQRPTETEKCVWVSLVEVWVSSGMPQGQGLWGQQTWVWHKLSWRRLPLTPLQNCQNLHRTGEIDSGRAHTEPCAHQDPGERSSDPTRDWPRLARECPGVSSGGVGWQWPAAGLGALSVAALAWDLLKVVTIIFITSTIVWPQVNNREGTQPHPSTENWIKDSLSRAPPIRTRPSFPLSFFHQEASITLLCFSIRGQINWKPHTQKTNLSDHMDHCLV